MSLHLPVRVPDAPTGTSAGIFAADTRKPAPKPAPIPARPPPTTPKPVVNIPHKVDKPKPT
mgnify:CR=1 FL=1